MRISTPTPCTSRNTHNSAQRQRYIKSPWLYLCMRVCTNTSTLADQMIQIDQQHSNKHKWTGRKIDYEAEKQSRIKNTEKRRENKKEQNQNQERNGKKNGQGIQCNRNKSTSAMQPSTPTWISLADLILMFFNSLNLLQIYTALSWEKRHTCAESKTFSSAFSRMAQVFNSTMSAEWASAAMEYPYFAASSSALKFCWERGAGASPRIPLSAESNSPAGGARASMGISRVQDRSIDHEPLCRTHSSGNHTSLSQPEVKRIHRTPHPLPTPFPNQPTKKDPRVPERGAR